MQSLNIFMQELLDYAGLYPPESLALKQSLINFSEYFVHPKKHWLGKFILPVHKIDETISILNKQNIFKNLNNKAEFSIIISSCETISDYSNILENDLSLIKKITKQFEKYIQISSIEFIPPKEIFKSNNIKLIDDTLKILTNKFYTLDTIHQFFCELDFFDNLEEYVNYIKIFNLNSLNQIGIKLRTGGTLPQQIPSSLNIAKAISICAKHQIPIKATAGLHVPVPNDNPHVGARLHGFLNIFSCLLFCYDNIMTIESMEKIISNYSYSNFKFTDSGLYLEDKFISNQKMVELRKLFIKSFGTCSFIEPIDHLKENHFF